jgi:hypothetical protein
LLQNDLRKGVSFSKESVFQKCVCWRVITLITFERDDQGLPGLGRALRWWLSRVRCEHEGLFLSYKDRFVILHYMYTYQVQPLETVWTVAWSELSRSAPKGYDGGEHLEDKEGECFVLVWAWRWPYSFWYNNQSKVVQAKREFRHSNLTMVRLQKPD